VSWLWVVMGKGCRIVSSEKGGNGKKAGGSGGFRGEVTSSQKGLTSSTEHKRKRALNKNKKREYQAAAEGRAV